MDSRFAELICGPLLFSVFPYKSKNLNFLLPPRPLQVHTFIYPILPLTPPQYPIQSQFSPLPWSPPPSVYGIWFLPDSVSTWLTTVKWPCDIRNPCVCRLTSRGKSANWSLLNYHAHGVHLYFNSNTKNPWKIYSFYREYQTSFFCPALACNFIVLMNAVDPAINSAPMKVFTILKAPPTLCWIYIVLELKQSRQS